MGGGLETAVGDEPLEGQRDEDVRRQAEHDQEGRLVFGALVEEEEPGDWVDQDAILDDVLQGRASVRQDQKDDDQVEDPSVVGVAA